jgi:hypothetical protein
MLLSLLILAACSPGAEKGAAPNGTAITSGTRAGTHIICEGGSCSYANGCPDGYDEFMAQVGPACVKHYGKEEISQWPGCRRSSDSCACTDAARDTQGNEIAWPDDTSLRCAPAGYRNYMVSTGGLSGVDEHGRKYHAIA